MSTQIKTYSYHSNLADKPSFQQKPPIIDMHLHAMEWDSGFKQLEPSSGLHAPDTEEEYMQKTLYYLEQYNIRAVTSGSLELVKKWKTINPHRIIPALAFSHPSEVSLDLIRESFSRGELAVLGEIMPQYEGLSPSDPIFKPILALAEELNIPVGIHMGLGPPGAAYEMAPKYRASLSNPLLLEEALVQHPKLRVYVMHAGWPMLNEMIHLLYSHPQVYVDVAVINWVLPRKEFHFYLKRIVEAGFYKRIMFGSDQMIWPEAIPIAIDAVESAKFLTNRQKRAILYTNAAQFLCI